MERNLSAKATKIRQRLTFTRSNSTQGLESTVVSPIEASPSSYRPRSATNPESPTHDQPTGDSRDPDPIRGYRFTDEPGYFRPASPFIDRQEIDKDLEADIKHACAMLSHNIDRGIPAGLSYRSAAPISIDRQNPAGQPSVDAAAPSSLKQNVIRLSAPKPISLKEESTKRHDSGLGTSFNSTSQPGRTYGNCVSRTNSSTRFYNKQPSTSPHSRSSGSRSRSHSLATTIEEDNQMERSYSSSPVPFPYSPPQFNSQWPSKPTTLDSPVSSLNESDTNTNAKKPDNFSPPISPQEASSLGGAARPWIHPSRDIQRVTDEEKPTAIQATKPKPVTRFYSSCNQIIGEFNSREWPTMNFREGRNLSIYSEVSNPSSRPETGNSRLGGSNEEKLSGGSLYQTFAGLNRRMSYSTSCLRDDSKHKEHVYSVAMPGLPPKNNRQNKVSLLLRKLTGLGMKKENNNENRVC
ncbi:hypothetical protein PITC_077010 [Penicillium italicum]|uniref:Uncharacterized protein n=1 Tax=Penicillium italicum TaxID=40296 RepID=A0A0A2KM18_PENIT|nr:hypothetical protein PITC_077010 [Penicillium italicum]